ncbi:uncharacterized protein LOC111049445 [Nilaparvata lugens]|uniref:uncharacterized protein LOC111049445 n=1 Tax=Nilaparvata lugens TaxID=108931 RepID=UPI000B98F3D4|nr:uncharacterized protein LOC111049445 [Nilaparvata lugens]
MLSAMIVIGIGTSVIFVCLQIVDSRAIIKKVSYEDNKKASQYYEENSYWEPIDRAISTKEMDNMTGNYDPSFVVLSRCDYASGFCRGNSGNKKYLREIIKKVQSVEVQFKNMANGNIVTVVLENHTECGCSSRKSDSLWHRVSYKVESVEGAPINSDQHLLLGGVAAVTQPLVALDVPSGDTNPMNPATSSATMCALRSHLTTMLLLFLMLNFTSL